MRLRTINETAAYLTERDPETALTKTALRRLVVTGVCPSIRIGAKYLVDLDVLEQVLQQGTETPQPAPAPERGAIRRVEV